MTLTSSSMKSINKIQVKIKIRTKSFIEDELDEVFTDALNLNIRNKPAENPSTTNKPKLQINQRPWKVSQPRQKQQKSKSSTTPEINTVTDLPKESSTEPLNDQTFEIKLNSEATTTTTEALTTRTPKRRPKPRKRSNRNKQRKVTKNSPPIEQNIEAIYKLYTDPNTQSTTTPPPDFFFGINIIL